MSLPVFLHPDLAGHVTGDDVLLDGDEGRHATVVRRTRVGEVVELTDGAGTRARVAVTGVGKGSLTGTVEKIASEPPERPALTVVQAIPKGDRGELAVEVLTEVGADLVVPWAAERCVAVWKGDRARKSHAKWVSASRAAAKQARRAWWPVVAAPVSTDAVVTLAREADLAVVLHEDADERVADLPVDEVRSVLLVVGPEGGVSEAELAALRGAGAHLVRLGSSVLRTSTAGVAGAAAVLARTQRWR